MTNKLKNLGLVVFALLMVSAMTASAAFAQNGKLTSTGPVTLAGTQPGGGPVTLTGTRTGSTESNAITAFGGRVECSAASYTGHRYNVTPHANIASGAVQITVTPTYGSCVLFGKPATVDMNGCDYVFDLEGTTGTDKFGLKTTIVCPKEKHIQITMFESSAAHTEGKSFCKLVITEKTESYAGLSAIDTTNGSVDITGTASGLKVDEESESGSCAKAETTEGGISLDMSISAKNASGESRAVSIADKGEFKWDDSYSHSNSVTMFGLASECMDTTYTGHKVEATPHANIPSGSGSITVSPMYKTCEPLLFGPTTIDMNGCDYEFDFEGTTGSDVYATRTKIVCPKEKHIQMTMFMNEAAHIEGKSFCKLTITENPAGYTGISATDTTAGSISISGILKGFTMHREGTGIFCSKVTTESAEFHLNTTFVGRNEAGELTSISLSHS